MACPVTQHLHSTQRQHSGARWDPGCSSLLDEAAERERHQSAFWRRPWPERRLGKARALPGQTQTGPWQSHAQSHSNNLSAQTLSVPGLSPGSAAFADRDAATVALSHSKCTTRGPDGSSPPPARSNHAPKACSSQGCQFIAWFPRCPGIHPSKNHRDPSKSTSG